MSALAIPAVRQLLARQAKGDKEEEEMVEKIENSCIKVSVSVLQPSQSDVSVRPQQERDSHSGRILQCGETSERGGVHKGRGRLYHHHNLPYRHS